MPRIRDDKNMGEKGELIDMILQKSQSVLQATDDPGLATSPSQATRVQPLHRLATRDQPFYFLLSRPLHHMT